MHITNKRKQVNTLPTIFTIDGEPASKANSRKWKGPGRLNKSDKALAYSDLFNLQCPYLLEPSEADILVAMKISYGTRRPDLDESLILDLMQGKLYKNDRQVKHKVITWGLDRVNPHSVILVAEVDNTFDVFKRFEETVLNCT